METGMLWFSRDGQSSNGVVESGHVNGFNGLRNLEHHVRTGDPDSGRTPPTQVLKRLHQLVHIGPHLRTLEVDSLVPRLIGGGVRHEGMATGTEGKR